THLLASQQIGQLGSWELDLMILDDLNANPLRWSDQCYRVLGYEPGEVEVSNEAFFARVHPQDRSLIETAIRQAIETGTVYSVDHRIIWPDGTERLVHERGEIIYDPQSHQPLKIIG